MAALLPSLGAHQRPNASIAMLATAAAVALLYFGRIFWITIIISLILALLLEPLVVLGLRMRIPRPVASALACLLAVVAIGLLAFGGYVQLMGLRDDLPLYGQRVNEMVDAVSARVEGVESKIVETVIPKRLRDADQPVAAPQQQQPVRRRQKAQAAPAPSPVEVRIRPEQKSILIYLYGYLRSIYDVLLMASFVPFLVYFMLSWRDHMRRSFLNLLDSQDRHIAGRTWRGITHVARAYVIGNFMLGVLLSVVSCIAFFLMGLPYWLIAGILSGFLSLLPYVGLPLALLPPLLDGLAVFSSFSPYVILIAIVAALHLLTLNLLYPRVVGGRLHLNPLAVTVALMLWGTLWGAVGLVLAIPITAGIKAVCDSVPSWAGYGKLLGD